MPLAALLLLAVSVGGADQKPPAALAALEARLRKVCPDAKFEQRAGELVVRCQTQQFMVHALSRTGEYAEKPHKEEGPKSRGFLLRVSLSEAAYKGPLRIPQTLKETYWDTFVNDYPAGRGEYLWLRLSHGRRADGKLLERIKGAVKEAGKR
jgi:hypothetical protein